MSIAREFARIATAIAMTAARRLSPGSRVVIYTDAAGEFVGVGSNSGDEDVQRILTCALTASGREDFPELVKAMR